jgi:3-phosphoshikimate 1-carboxyvinyltransferase
VLRFLAPLALLVDGALSLDGSARLGERPHHGLVHALEQLGVEVTRAENGLLPLLLRRRRSSSQDSQQEVAVDATRSSQFASGLLMVAPLLPGGLKLALKGEPVSLPYLELTAATMRSRGVRVSVDGPRWAVEPGRYQSGPQTIEGDWSSAAFLLAAATIAGRPVHVENVTEDSAQGDRAIVGFLAELARPRPHAFDLSECPDLLPPLAAAAVFASHPSVIAGVGHARIKESDRVATLAQGLAAAGARAEERPDALCVEPGGSLRPARLDPRGDHRMAMAFALLGLRAEGIEVTDRDCVSKSYPGFWEDLARLRCTR